MTMYGFNDALFMQSVYFSIEKINDVYIPLKNISHKQTEVPEPLTLFIHITKNKRGNEKKNFPVHVYLCVCMNVCYILYLYTFKDIKLLYAARHIHFLMNSIYI